MHTIVTTNANELINGDLILSPAGRWETVSYVNTFSNYLFLREIGTTWGPQEKPARWRVSTTTMFTVSRSDLTATVALFDFTGPNSALFAIGVDTPGRKEFRDPVVIIATAETTRGHGWAVLDAYGSKPAEAPTTIAEGLTKARARTQLKTLGRSFAKDHGLTTDLANVRTH